MSINLREINKPLLTFGEPFFGLLSTSSAIKQFNINLNPDYQRDHVWTLYQKEAFVGHILEGGETLPVVINKGDEYKNFISEVIDGKQRIQACLDWENGDIYGKTNKGVLIHMTDLDEVGTRMVDNMIGLKYAMVKLCRIEILELYLKLNSGGTLHKQFEIDKVKELLLEERRDATS